MDDNLLHLKVRQLRKQLNLSQSAFAQQIGETRANYQQMENGKVRISGPLLEKIVQVFNVDANWLLRPNENDRPNVNQNTTNKIRNINEGMRYTPSKQDNQANDVTMKYIATLEKRIAELEERIRKTEK